MKTIETKTRIAVLGAGPSALVAAFRITEEPDWSDKYEITVYQQGWRVGGKCATGRDLDKHLRVYEHGIHGFLGCYFNALTVMEKVFDALGRDPKHPVPDFEHAFLGGSGVIRYEMVDGKMKKWPIYAPPRWWGLEAADGTPPSHSALMKLAPKVARMEDYIEGMIRLGMGYMMQSYAKTFRNLATYAYILKTGTPVRAGGMKHPVTPDAQTLDTRLADGAEELNTRLFDLIVRAGAAAKDKDIAKVGAVFREGFTYLMTIVKAGGGANESERDRLRRLALVLDFVATILIGIVKDEVIFKGFVAVDDLDHVAWLRKHGANPATINSPLTSSTPNITYQYPSGDSIREPVMAAGAYLHWTMMTFTYLGEFIQLFDAGSGETLIAPLHEILEKRGVKFAFFHTITDIRADKTMEIAEVDVDVQATVTKGEFAYAPYVEVPRKKKLGWSEGLKCWPDRPLYAQLREGKALEASGADLESFWCDWAPVGRKTLKRGEDFDKVILGISVGALPYLTGDLAKRHKPWRDMLKHARTVATQAMQVWLNKTPWELGWNGYTNEYDGYMLSANFMTQPNGQGDFTKYIKYENWPEDHTPASLILLCGTIPFYHEIDGTEGAAFPRQITEQVKHQSIQFLQATGGFMLPGATVAEQKGYGDPFSFDFDLFHPVHPEVKGKEKRGAARFDDQYWRVNINPSDNYVSTPPGSTKYRLKASETGFANLSIAGDWTYNGLNVGSMEGSVRSGLLAAEAILGIPPSNTGVIGYEPALAVPKGAAKAASKGKARKAKA